MRASACIVLTAMLMPGCATHRSNVEQHMLIPAGASRYEMDPRQVFVMPLPLDAEAPAVPDDLGRRDLAPTTVCAELVVDEGGRVQRVAPLQDAGCGQGEGAVVAPLQQAVQARLQQWRFVPAVICTFADAQAAEAAAGTCPEDQAQRREVSVRLGYAFTFQVVNGKRSVAQARTR